MVNNSPTHRGNDGRELAGGGKKKRTKKSDVRKPTTIGRSITTTLDLPDGKHVYSTTINSKGKRVSDGYKVSEPPISDLEKKRIKDNINKNLDASGRPKLFKTFDDKLKFKKRLNDAYDNINKNLDASGRPKLFKTFDDELKFKKQLNDAYDNFKKVKAEQEQEDRNNKWYRKAWNNIKNGYTTNDAIGAGANTIGSLLSYGLNKNMLNNMSYRPEPVYNIARKLKTSYNINPQLDAVRRNLGETEDNIDSNTSSSRVALARKQEARNNSLYSINNLYGQKENIETELINKDISNQQAIANANINAYNAWQEGKTNFENNINEKNAENNISLVNNLNSTISNTIQRKEQREADNRTLMANALAYQHLPIEEFEQLGIVSPENRAAYRRGHALKKIKSLYDNL